MATMIGVSGAWNTIERRIQAMGYKVNRPADIEPLIKELRDLQPSSVEAIQNRTTLEVESIQRQIAQLRAEKGLFRQFFNSFKIDRLRSQVNGLKRQEQISIAIIDNNISNLEYFLRSPDLMGARAELTVMKELGKLSSRFTVINNVALRATRQIKFNGASLHSAQIDHMVLGPCGLFVIETKLWSQKFVESHRYHNPYNQVQRASYLCYDICRSMGYQSPVRSIIASFGKLPEPPASSHVKVLQPHELVGYIEWFREAKLNTGQLQYLQQYFSRWAHM